MLRKIAWWIFWRVTLPKWLAPYWFKFAVGAKVMQRIK
jgi:hypothetical protein